MTLDAARAHQPPSCCTAATLLIAVADFLRRAENFDLCVSVHRPRHSPCWRHSRAHLR